MGADTCLVKSSTLLGSMEFDPQQKVKVKSADDSVAETHLHKEGVKSLFTFHLEVELAYNGILGRDFLRQSRARVYYDKNLVTFKQGR
jgi:hypothetical protein